MNRKNHKVQLTSLKYTSGGAIGWGLCSGKKINLLIKRDIVERESSFLVGHFYDVEGKKSSHKVYGQQIVVESLTVATLENEQIFEYLARAKHFQNIGLGRAKLNRLRTSFHKTPNRLIRLLNSGKIEKIAELIGPATASNLLQKWSENKLEIDCVNFLAENGLPTRIAFNLIIIYGAAARQRVIKNPYILVPFVGFELADAFAIGQGFDPNSQYRLAHLVASIMKRELELGSSLISWNNLLTKLTRKSLGDIDASKSECLAAAIENGTVLTKGDHFQLPACTRMERTVRNFLTDVLTKPSLKAFDKEIELVLARYEANAPYPLSSEQKEAVKLVLNNNVSCITGGAGTGKSTVIDAVIYAAKTLHGADSWAVALSGIAADRLRESTGQDAYTIAKFLGMIKSDQIQFGQDTLLIIDETSMLGVPSLFSLFSKLPVNDLFKRLRIVFVGDCGQLSPIEYGYPFLQFCKELPTAELTSIFRQAKGSSISIAARSIRQGCASFEQNDEFSFIQVEGENEIITKCSELAFELGLDQTRIIAPTRKLTRKINGLMQHKLHNKNDPLLSGLLSVYQDEPIIFGANNYDYSVWNGTQGNLVTVNANEFVVDIAGEEFTLPMEKLFDFKVELSYALTGHRTQGASFQNVVIPIVDSLMLDRLWLYTAITRAKKKCILVGPEDILRGKVQEKPKAISRLTQRLTPNVLTH